MAAGCLEELAGAVKSGIESMEAAPIAWLWTLNRRRGLLSLAFWGLLAICAGLPEGWMDWTCFEMNDKCTLSRSTSWDAVHLVTGSIELTLAIVLAYVRIPPNAFEAVLCFVYVAHMAGNTMTLLNEWQFTVFTSMTNPFFSLCFGMSGVRIMPFIITSTINIAIVVARTWNTDWVDRPATASILCLVCSAVLVVAQHMHWKHLYDTEQELLLEKEAFESLLSTVCDADCWTAADGDTILRSDRRLDHIMGMKTEGSRLSKYLSEGDRKRLEQATTGTTAKEAAPKALVRLLPVTVRRPCEVSVDVECFIVDRRGVAKPRRSRRSPLGFLIGFRLSAADTESSCEPPDIEAGLGEDAESYQGTRWLTDSFSPCSRFTCQEINDDVGTPASRAAISAISCPASSIPATLASAALPPPAMHACSMADLLAALRGGDSSIGIPVAAATQERETVMAAVQMVCEHAKGGALLAIARASAFKHIFPGTDYHGDSAQPALRACDKSYMTERLRGLHISDPRFSAAFSEFTEHSDDDRWPADHADPAARGQPKDGAFLISTGGYRLKAAVKLLGLPPARHWDSVGTKHETAMACAWAVKGAHVLVRSDSGSVHYIVRDGDILHVSKISPSGPATASL